MPRIRDLHEEKPPFIALKTKRIACFAELYVALKHSEHDAHVGVMAHTVLNNDERPINAVIVRNKETNASVLIGFDDKGDNCGTINIIGAPGRNNQNRMTGDEVDAVFSHLANEVGGTLYTTAISFNTDRHKLEVTGGSYAQMTPEKRLSLIAHATSEIMSATLNEVMGRVVADKERMASYIQDVVTTGADLCVDKSALTYQRSKKDRAPSHD